MPAGNTLGKDKIIRDTVHDVGLIQNVTRNTCPRYVIYNVNTDASGNVFLNTSKDGHQILGAFPLYGNIRITAVGYYNGAYYAFCNDFDGSSCANRAVTIGVLYVD